ncbi:MAG: radical SAM protein [Bacteroidales bacterium]|nr:radical SAM protein [Bacteroidales bacterium]
MQIVSHNIGLAGLDPENAAFYLKGAGIEEKYARRLLYWIYRRGVRAFSEIDDMPAKVLKQLAASFETGLTLPTSSACSSDGSVKYLFSNRDGLLHEAVYLPEGKRRTVCVSVQAGCRMGCRFCATGLNGWRGNLTAGEIVNQVISIPHEATNVVMMGMGEPGDNIDEVIKACNILTAEWGLATGHSRVTVSTVGITPALRRLLDETRCNITLSLHSPFDGERQAVIPSEKRWPFRKSLTLLKAHAHDRKRRFTVAYVMMKGLNDTQNHLEGLKRLLEGTRIKVNLLPYHPFEGDAGVSSDHETMMRFKHLLVTSGIEATVRRSRGSDIAAACGMLAAGGQTLTA